MTHLPGEWLSLGGAARRLGVHPSTVRNWTDRGLLACHRTQGGHRRYLSSEIDAWLQSQSDQMNGVNLVIENALRNTRFSISEGRLSNESWYIKLDEEARQQYRHSGRALLQGLINSITGDEINNIDADALGYEYASRGYRYRLSSVEATSAYLFFRNVLLELILGVYETGAVRSPQAWGDMFRRIIGFTDRILSKLLETYEQYLKSRVFEPKS